MQWQNTLRDLSGQIDHGLQKVQLQTIYEEEGLTIIKGANHYDI